MEYAKIVNGEVENIGKLPKALKTKDNWIIGFDLLDNESLKEHGYLPIEENKCTISQEEIRLDDTVDIVERQVTITWNKRNKTTAEINADRANYAIKRANAYKEEVDPITAEIERLKDEPETPEILAEIAEKITARNAIVDAIKLRYPKPTV